MLGSCWLVLWHSLFSRRCVPLCWGLTVVLGNIPACCVVAAALLLRRACAGFLVALCCCGLLARSGLGGLFHLLFWPGRGLLLWLVVEIVLIHGDVSGWWLWLPRPSLPAPGVQRRQVSRWLLCCLCPLSLLAGTSCSGGRRCCCCLFVCWGCPALLWVRRLPRGLLRGPLWRWLLVVAGRLRRGLGPRLPPYPHNGVRVKMLQGCSQPLPGILRALLRALCGCCCHCILGLCACFLAWGLCRGRVCLLL